jgi:hypothetical protein
VKPKAFEPMFNGDLQRYETSVFATDGLTIEQVWSIATREVEAKKLKRVFARGVILTEVVAGVALEALPDTPPERHVVLVGWPEGPDRKPDRIHIQQQLAEKASLKHREAAKQL